ncbi:choline TMA-lyase-activating enzyme [uncultured Mailhella sp.]|uniref:choline TMA-lyase-activating enzyme n=1 Tax=uncultured Mailhella sp. TaxID=1981031 RepID=UPI002601BBD6|nr:choline TMA-lyase-activating enzyme [uncultured Mailhella sp.]
MVERKALIFNIQKYNLYDGPGIRTLVFFKGCPLRCLWCSNPEGQLRSFQILFKKDRCVDCGACAAACPAGVHVMEGSRHTVKREAECVGCRRCEEACTQAALGVSGEYRTISELMEIIEEDMPFYQSSGGGVTLSGGEVLMQPEAAINLLTACRQRGINTAIETCGYARPGVVRRAAEVTDLFLFDVKHMDSDRHRQLTGVRNEPILDNLRWLLENRCHVKVRVPLLKGINDGERDIEALVRFLSPYRDHRNCKGIDLLPYHKLGVGKYAQLDRSYPLPGDPALSDADLARVERIIRQYDFPVTIVRH